MFCAVLQACISRSKAINRKTNELPRPESDKKINPSVAGVRSLIELPASSEAAPGALPGLKQQRQDAFGGPILGARGTRTQRPHPGT